jgi:hypothetical protein
LSDTAPDPARVTARDIVKRLRACAAGTSPDGDVMIVIPEQARVLVHLIDLLDTSTDPDNMVLLSARHAGLRRALIDVVSATCTAVPADIVVDRIHDRAVAGLAADLT